MTAYNRPETPRRIESGRNPLVRELRLLERDRGARTRSGLYLAWGLHLAQEALLARAPVRSAWLGPALDRTAEGRRLGEELPGHCRSILRTTTRLLDTIIPGCGDQGILLLVERQRRTADDLIHGGADLLLATHGVQDPGNIGSIVRTAAALGIDGLLVLEGCADPYSSRAVRAAMGAQYRVRIADGSSEDVLASLERAGLQIVTSDVAQGLPPRAIDLRRPTALFVGSEGAGLPPSILDRATQAVRIPMAAGSASLNVHAAATILLYEAARQRQDSGSG
jgi:TrmH family RNA methyltransferase